MRGTDRFGAVAITWRALPLLPGPRFLAEIDAHQGSEARRMKLRPKHFVEKRHGYSIQPEGRASKGA